MRADHIGMAVAGVFAVGTLVVVGCTGGGGGIDLGDLGVRQRPIMTFENAPNSNEKAKPSNEGVTSTSERGPTSYEPIPGSGAGPGAAQFDCAGTYECVETDSTPRTFTVVLTARPGGGCVGRFGNDTVGILSNGTAVNQRGELAGTWTGSLETGVQVDITDSNDDPICRRVSRTGGEQTDDRETGGNPGTSGGTSGSGTGGGTPGSGTGGGTGGGGGGVTPGVGTSGSSGTSGGG